MNHTNSLAQSLQAKWIVEGNCFWLFDVLISVQLFQSCLVQNLFVDCHIDAVLEIS